MRPASSPPELPPCCVHAALAAALTVPGDAADFQALRHGTWPDRTAVLSSIDRLHRLLIAETLSASLANETPQRRVERELDEIDSVLTAQIRLALEFPARIGNEAAAGAPDLGAAAQHRSHRCRRPGLEGCRL